MLGRRHADARADATPTPERRHDDGLIEEDATKVKAVADAGVLGEFVKRWEARWPEGIHQASPIQMSKFGRLLDKLTVDDLLARADRFFDDDSDWLIQHKHPLSAFCQRINSYEAPEPTMRPSSRIRNCPKCGAMERGQDDACDSCDWTR